MNVPTKDILTWHPVARAPGYFVDELGQVKGPSGRILKPTISRFGYERIEVKGRLVAVHILVCETFHGSKPPGKQVAHGDGNRRNNQPSNLRWATPKENSGDRILHGTSGKGEKNGRAIITEDIVREIRREYSQNMGPVYVRRGTRAALAKKFGVNIDVIKDVVSGGSWAHVV